MLQLASYRVVERPSSPGSFDVLDPATGHVVAVASPPVIPVFPKPKPSPGSAIMARLLRYRLFLNLFALISLPIYLMQVIPGRGLLPPKESRPRLVVRRAGDGDVVLALRQASGFMYDSRRVSNGQGALIAHFRSRSKTTVRGGFAIIDLRGLADDGSDISDRPWLGVVEPAGEFFRVRLVVDRDAGLIALRKPAGIDGADQQRSRTARGDCDVEATADLQDDPTSKVVVLAAALTLAWWPSS